jgi:hypothetical protein
LAHAAGWFRSTAPALPLLVPVASGSAAVVLVGCACMAGVPVAAAAGAAGVLVGWALVVGTLVAAGDSPPQAASIGSSNPVSMSNNTIR